MADKVQLPKDVEDYIIGIWRFREVGEPRLWCITYCYEGYYYDVSGAKTLNSALNKLRKSIKKLKASK